MEGFLENKVHGRRTFPYTVYRGKLPEYDRGYPLHWHPEMELISIEDGRGIILIRHQRFSVAPGDLLLVPPQVVHGIEQLGDAHMEYYNILFRFSLLEGGPPDGCFDKYLQPILDGDRVLPCHLPAGDPLNALLTPHIQELIRYRRESREGYELLVKANLFAIAHHLSLHSREASPLQHALHSSYDKLKPALHHIQTHYAAPIPVEQAAALCGFSPSHFMTLFRQLTGSSFTQYLKQYRLELAAGQLLQTDLPVSQIARQTGFQNLSYFTRAFSAQYGQTPGEYRKA